MLEYQTTMSSHDVIIFNGFLFLFFCHSQCRISHKTNKIKKKQLTEETKKKLQTQKCKKKLLLFCFGFCTCTVLLCCLYNGVMLLILSKNKKELIFFFLKRKSTAWRLLRALHRNYFYHLTNDERQCPLLLIRMLNFRKQPYECICMRVHC